MSLTSRHSLGFETLERKQMLAGDVLVSMMGGKLVLEGDAESNQIQISAGATAGSLIIQGLAGTEIRRADADPTDPPAPATGLVVQGVRGNVHVSLGDGDDTVVVQNGQFRRGLTINMGAGADTVRIGGSADAGDPGELAVRGSLLIRTGADNDEVFVDAAQVGGFLAIATEGGEDSVNVGVTSDAGAAGLSDSAAVRARLGIDILLGDGEDKSLIRDVSTHGLLAMGGGEGVDIIEVDDSAARILGIRGGSDDAVDTVELSGLVIGHAAIGLGGGADQLSVVDSAFSSLLVDLGAGNDSLSISAVTATRALLAGGAGDADELTDAGDSTIERLAVTGFELPSDVNTDPLLPRHGRPGQLGGSIGRLLGRLRR
jgi:hypothetical protein